MDRLSVAVLNRGGMAVGWEGLLHANSRFDPTSRSAVTCTPHRPLPTSAHTMLCIQSHRRWIPAWRRREKRALFPPRCCLGRSVLSSSNVAQALCNPSPRHGFHLVLDGSSGSPLTGDGRMQAFLQQRVVHMHPSPLPYSNEASRPIQPSGGSRYLHLSSACVVPAARESPIL